MNEETKIPSLEIISASDLLQLELPPLAYAIREILPQGIFILAGSGKIGKSWLALDMCLGVASGGKLWEYQALEGEVLYLALEDNYRRLKNRLDELQEESGADAKKLFFTIASRGINNGLIDQVNEFISFFPNTKLIVIDTLEHVRNTNSEGSIYTHDYNDIKSLRPITEAHDVTVLLVHHTRKMYDPDPLNMLTGSTGLVGAVDGVWILEKEKRTEDIGKLTLVNRDTVGYCFKVEFDKDNCKWNCLGIHEETKQKDKFDLCVLIHEFLEIEWQGTATELVKELSNDNVTTSAITKKLNKSSERLYEEFGIRYSYDRTRKKRIITLFREVIVAEAITM